MQHMSCLCELAILQIAGLCFISTSQTTDEFCFSVVDVTSSAYPPLEEVSLYCTDEVP